MLVNIMCICTFCNLGNQGEPFSLNVGSYSGCFAHSLNCVGNDGQTMAGYQETTHQPRLHGLPALVWQTDSISSVLCGAQWRPSCVISWQNCQTWIFYNLSSWLSGGVEWGKDSVLLSWVPSFNPPAVLWQHEVGPSWYPLCRQGNRATAMYGHHAKAWIWFSPPTSPGGWGCHGLPQAERLCPPLSRRGMFLVTFVSVRGGVNVGETEGEVMVRMMWI